MIRSGSKNRLNQCVLAAKVYIILPIRCSYMPRRCLWCVIGPCQFLQSKGGFIHAQVYSLHKDSKDAGSLHLTKQPLQGSSSQDLRPFEFTPTPRVSPAQLKGITKYTKLMSVHNCTVMLFMQILDRSIGQKRIFMLKMLGKCRQFLQQNFFVDNVKLNLCSVRISTKLSQNISKVTVFQSFPVIILSFSETAKFF